MSNPRVIKKACFIVLLLFIINFIFTIVGIQYGTPETSLIGVIFLACLSIVGSFLLLLYVLKGNETFDVVQDLQNEYEGKLKICPDCGVKNDLGTSECKMCGKAI